MRKLSEIAQAMVAAQKGRPLPKTKAVPEISENDVIGPCRVELAKDRWFLLRPDGELMSMETGELFASQRDALIGILLEGK